MVESLKWEKLEERRKTNRLCMLYKIKNGLIDIDSHQYIQSNDSMTRGSPRFLCRPTTLYIFARAVERQSAIYTENSGFASPTLGQHISTFRGYRILFSIRNPYINRFTNHFSIHS
jgi:hypothetical protein